jgi:hypothetical protein
MSTEVSEAIASMLAERAVSRTSAFEQRTSALAEIRKTFKRRRDAGLKSRHAEKSARNRAAGTVV